MFGAKKYLVQNFLGARAPLGLVHVRETQKVETQKVLELYGIAIVSTMVQGWFF